MAAFTMTKTLGKYVDATGAEFRRKIPTGYYSQEGLAWTAGSAAKPTLPKGIRPRHAMVVTAGGVHRKVIVPTDAALAAMVPATTTLNINIGGISTSGTVNSLQGEHNLGQG